jgi:HPt (histidine-containing phosphotransfer) domain-containing protein
VDVFFCREYLYRCMILLSEVADKIRKEICAWPSHQNLNVMIQIEPSLEDARMGDEAIFTELLIMPIGLLPGSVSDLEIIIDGNKRELCISFRFDNTEVLSKPLWKNLAEKASVWNPQIRIENNGVVIILNLPSSSSAPPADLEAMARETGIQPDDARLIFRGFLNNAREYIRTLAEGTEVHGKDSCFRAAHSLKGAGKNFRAPELIASAKKMENKIRENQDTTEDLQQLESIWNRMELWFEEGEL